MSTASSLPKPTVKPPLKWAGGKRWLVPHLAEIWGPHSDRRFIEPFSGGLAITLGLTPKKAWINDINPHLINFYNHIREGLEITIHLENEEEAYYKKRDRFNQLLERKEEKTSEAAQLFYYLNRTGFNGLCRFNSKGRYNIPFGRTKTINYRREFSDLQSHFKKWKFTHTDFEKMSLQPTDFIYADPPYDVPFTQYSTGGFSWDDQVRTANWLAKHPGPVVLSNEATDRIIQLYESLGFQTIILDAPRLISCTGNRKKAKEVLATRNI